MSVIKSFYSIISNAANTRGTAATKAKRGASAEAALPWSLGADVVAAEEEVAEDAEDAEVADDAEVAVDEAAVAVLVLVAELLSNFS